MLRLHLAVRLYGLLVLAAGLGAAGEAEGPPRDEVPAAARSEESRFVHRILLRDEDGEKIEPDSEVPYSPRQTCASSQCHNYEAANLGTHTRMLAGARHQPPAHVWTRYQATGGVAAPLARGFLPPQDGAFDSARHLSLFEFARQFGSFHPGGGRVELDSEGKRLDKELAANQDLAKGEDPDYAGARWHQSGVLEKDCMMCHGLEGYDHIERAIQIDKMAFKWAPTVGAGLGTVQGFGTRRKVAYNAARFDAEGKVDLPVGRPTDRNCLACHRRPARGEATWRDCLEADVHSLAGLACVDCHSCGVDHVMFGDRRVEPRPEWASLTCQGCHDSGRLGSPLPQHAGLPRLHLERISCESCHSGPRPRLVPLALSQPARVQWGVPLTSDEPAGPAVYAPIYARDDTGTLQLGVRLLPQWYAERTEEGLVPVSDSTLRRAVLRYARKAIADDDGDGQAEVNTREEIAAILGALRKSRVDQPVLLAQGTAYELDEEGEITTAPHEASRPVDNRLAHNVRPAWQALGAEGCEECHDAQAPFFRSIAITRALDEEGEAEGPPLFQRMGRTESDLAIGDFREKVLRPYAWWVVLLAVVAMGLHLVIFGPHRAELTGERVQRFNALERLAHFVLLASFVVLALTGVWIVSGLEEVLGLAVTSVHRGASWFLVGSAALAGLIWVRDMIFSRLDVGWFKVLGGYLGYRGRVPAGRFNAGQKLFFWLILLVVGCLAVTGWMIMYELKTQHHVLAYTLHELCAYLMVLFILGHAYLGTLANPGTLRAIFEGKVSRDWARMHHPDWEPAKQEPEG
ncbi:MAG: cytochrome b/b6 domain-containing protein [Candidatus Brocadiia bacterium]